MGCSASKPVVHPGSTKPAASPRKPAPGSAYAISPEPLPAGSTGTLTQQSSADTPSSHPPAAEVRGQPPPAPAPAPAPAPDPTVRIAAAEASPAHVPTDRSIGAAAKPDVTQRRTSIKDPKSTGNAAYHTEGRINDYYTITGGKPIGKGGFGEVRLGTRKSDGKP